MAEQEDKILQMNIYQKLAKIRAIADVVSKSKRGYNYSYSDITEILAKVTAGMNKYRVSLLPKLVAESARVQQITAVNTKMDKTGKAFEQTTTEMLVTSDMVFVWVNEDNPNDVVEIPWVIIGSQADPSQAFGSGLTYCTRYFLTSYFQIGQSAEQDVDKYRKKQREAQEAEDKAIAEEIIGKFDVLLKTYLADNRDKDTEVKQFISKYIKNSNYFSITEPVLAGKLLKDFQDKYLGEGVSK